MFRVFFFLAIAVFRINNAAVIILPHAETPLGLADQKGCYVPDLKRVLKYNKPYSLTGSCVQYTCMINNETYYDTCGKVAVSDGCRVVKGNKALPFSKCCDTVLCIATISVLHG